MHHSFSRERKAQPTKQKLPNFKELNQPCQREVKVANGATLKISKKRTNVPYEKMGMRQKGAAPISTSVFLRTFMHLCRHFIFCTEKMV